jgi:hypothetical protein
MILPAVSLLLLCHPFWHQMVHGQLNLLLLLLLTGVWAADRQGHPSRAGAFLGVATAIKFYPGFLFLYFVLRRDWRAIGAGLVSLAAITALTAAVLGPDAYRSYFIDVLPQTSLRRADWHNLSMSGVSCKLFDKPLHLPPVQIQPLVESPVLAVLGMIGTLVAVSAFLAWVVRHTNHASPTRERTKWGLARQEAVPVPILSGRSHDTDLAFALTIIGMVLVSPITWDHYLLVLALPLAILWQRLRGRWIGRIVLVSLLAVLWLQPAKVMTFGLGVLDAAGLARPGGRWVAGPLATLTALSIPCYALVGIFGLAIWTSFVGWTESSRSTDADLH